MHSSKSLLLAVLFVSFAAMSFAQQTDRTSPIIYTSLEGENGQAVNQDSVVLLDMAAAEDTVEIKGVHPFIREDKVISEKSYWSMYVAFGGNIYDGDFTNEKKHSFFLPVASIGFTSHFTNTWALGLEYKFRNYGVFGKKGHADKLLRGHTNQINGYLTMDVMNMFVPGYTKKIFALDLILGGGVFWYKNSIYYPNEYKDDLHRDFVFVQNTINQTPMSNDKYKAMGMFVGGMSFEFNVSRSLQVGLRATYNYSTTDQWDGRIRGNNNDGAFDAEVLLRYKINAINKSNTRNFRSDDALAKIVKESNIDPYVKEEPVKESVKDTIYVITRDTVYVINKNSQVGGKMTETIPGGYDESDEIKNAHYYYVVYFDNDDPNLDAMAKLIVQEASMKIQELGDVYALVIGSCDNTGAVEYNKWLAVARAHNVANELINNYGVREDRIHTVGRGIMIDNRPEGSYRPNRRVEIHLLNKTDFDQAVQIYKEFESNKNVQKGSALRKNGEELKLRSQVRITVPQDLNIAEADQIIVNQSTTLQLLAEKYYRNKNCWIYLYLANGETVAIPDQVVENTTLILPKLTDKQRKVTTNEVSELIKQYVSK